MGKKMITIPFDLELAKKINNGERNGMIVTLLNDSLLTFFICLSYTSNHQNC